MSNARDRILDALESLLAETGPSGATLEAVAARAGVSKGGLLYHFANKESLYAAFLDRLRQLAAADVEAMHRSPESAIARFLESSTVANDSFTRTFLAALLLAGAREADVEGALAESIEGWYEAIAAQVGDPVLARLIHLAGDGLYLHALVGAGRADLDREVMSRLLELMTQQRGSG